MGCVVTEVAGHPSHGYTNLAIKRESRAAACARCAARGAQCRGTLAAYSTLCGGVSILVDLDDVVDVVGSAVRYFIHITSIASI